MFALILIVHVASAPAGGASAGVPSSTLVGNFETMDACQKAADSARFINKKDGGAIGIAYVCVAAQ